MRRLPSPPLTADEKADIVRLLPEHGAAYVAEWIGCSRAAVTKHAKLMGITDWPRPSGYRRPSLAARDVPGVSKVCLGCDESKPLGDFQALKIGRFGRRSKCKACTKAARPRRRPVSIRQELPR